MFNKFIQSPYINLLSGIILLLTSGYEVWNTIEVFAAGAHHGVFLFSLVQILKSFPEISEEIKGLNASIKST